MKHETVLPKNIRQIGEIQQDKKVYLEDYVMTYLQKKGKTGEADCAGILVGRKEEEEDCRYVFVKGVVLLDPEAEPEQRWERLEEDRQKYFPDQETTGYFVLGTLDETALQEKMGELLKSSPVIFHMQEGEETVYWSEKNQYQRLKGYFVFYERNPQMQKYMAERETPHRVEEEEGSSDKAILSFREKVKAKNEGRRAGGWRYLASSFLVLTILLLGVTIINNYDKMKSMEAAITRISLEQDKEQKEITLVQASASGDNVSAQTQDKTSQNAEPEQETAVNPEQSRDGLEGERDAAITTSAGVTLEGLLEETAQQTSGKNISSGETVDEVLANQINDGNGAVESQNVNGESKAVESQNINGESKAVESQNINGESGVVETQNINEGNGAPEAQNTNAGNETADSEDGDGGAAGEEPADPTSSGAVISDAGSSTLQALAERNYSAESAASVTQGSTDSLTASSDRLNRAAYTVRYGDTLADISMKYYGTLDKVEEICSLNHIDDANMIVPGQKIVLP